MDYFERNKSSIFQIESFLIYSFPKFLSNKCKISISVRSTIRLPARHRLLPQIQTLLPLQLLTMLKMVRLDHESLATGPLRRISY